MPRKRKGQPENYDKAFPTALRKLIDERGITQQILADELGKSRQAISYYCDGSSSPDWETIVKIASFFSVSADYLLGLSEEQTPDQSIQAVCRFTGLSEKAIKNLSYYANIGFTDGSHDATQIIGKRLLSLLFESGNFFTILIYLRQCAWAYSLKRNKKTIFTSCDNTETERIFAEDGRIIIKASDAVAFYANTAADYLKQFVNDELQTFADQICQE